MYKILETFRTILNYLCLNYQKKVFLKYYKNILAGRGKHYFLLKYCT